MGRPTSIETLTGKDISHLITILGQKASNMKICVSSVGDTLDSEIDDEFGMCEYFIIVDPDTMEFEAILNEASHSPTGTGHQAAQAVVDIKVDVVLTGFVGHHGLHVLQSAGIKVVTGFEGTVRSAIERYKSRHLTKE